MKLGSFDWDAELRLELGRPKLKKVILLTQIAILIPVRAAPYEVPEKLLQNEL